MTKNFKMLVTISGLLGFAFTAAASDIEQYRMRDCSDPVSATIAKDVAEQVRYGLKYVPGAISVSVDNCVPMWSTKMLGGAVLAVHSPDTCGAKIKFDSRDDAMTFAGYAKIFGSKRSAITRIDSKGYQANADVCGEDSVSY